MAAERKPGVFHAVDNSKQKEQKQTAEYTEDAQGIANASNGNTDGLEIYP